MQGGCGVAAGWLQGGVQGRCRLIMHLLTYVAGRFRATWPPSPLYEARSGSRSALSRLGLQRSFNLERGSEKRGEGRGGETGEERGEGGLRLVI